MPKNSKSLLLTLSCMLLASGAYADTYNLGYVSFDVTLPPLAQVDIHNQTSSNSSGDSTFPVTSTVLLSSYDLTVNFFGGGSESFTTSDGYFTLDPDGLDYDGQADFNTATSPVSSVTLTGTVDTTSVSLFDGTTDTINPNFSLTITDPLGILSDGDFGILTVSSAGSTGPSSIPEPSSWALFGLGLAAFAAFRSRRRFGQTISRFIVPSIALAALAATFPVPSKAIAAATIKLNTSTSPSSGISGSSDVWVTGSGFPGAPSLAGTTLTLSSSCGGAAAATTIPIAEKQILGSTYEVEFLVPATLATGTYYVSIAGDTTTGATFASSGGNDCSAIRVTHTATALAACNPGSSMGILAYNPTGAASTPVTAYVPEGAWEYGTTGIQVVPIEGGGTPTSITTPQDINSCSSNSSTGTTVCIDNYTGIYIVQGSTITHTLSSSADSTTSFSGGSCENCTVAINNTAGTQGQAVIGIGDSSSTAGVALQFLDLATLTLGSPVPLSYKLSEDILWDPLRNRVLSPDEQDYFDLVNITGTGVPGTTTEYYNPMNPTYDPYGSYNPEADSAGLDCTTDIAVVPLEFTGELWLSDLSQATFTPGSSGSAGTWTAPSQTYRFPEFENMEAGASAVAVAPGSTHLGIVNGEFGGNLIGAIQLPATSGTGTPAVVDYVAATLPATPDSCTFSAGFDPHTTTAYTSPNNGKAYGVVANWIYGSSSYYPDYVAVVDLAALLAAPRSSGTHSVDPSYDLVANGVVTYYSTGLPNCKGSVSTSSEIHSDLLKAVKPAVAPAPQAPVMPVNKPVHP